jgi:hypothetical protein
MNKPYSAIHSPKKNLARGINQRATGHYRVLYRGISALEKTTPSGIFCCWLQLLAQFPCVKNISDYPKEKAEQAT